MASGFKGFRHIPLGLCSGFKAKCHDFQLSFSSFFFFLLFFLFHWENFIGLLFMGVLNLLKVVNETRVGYLKLRRLGSFSGY